MKRITALTAIVVTLLLSACGGSDKPLPLPTAVISVIGADNNTFSLKDGPVTVELGSTSSSTERDASLSRQWQLVAKPELSTAELTNTDKENTKIITDLPGKYVVSLIVTDGTERSEATRITLTATSSVPVAVTQSVYSIKLGTDELALDASHSSLPTGETGELDYLWRIIEKPQDSAGYLSLKDQSQPTLQLDVAGDYKLQLVVSFNGVDSEPSNVVVTVSSGNAPPVATVEDITIELGQEVVLDASASVDPEGEALQYRWRWDHSAVKPSAMPIPELTGATTEKLRVIPQAVGTYHLVFFVFDGQWKSTEKDVLVTVKNVTKPTTNEAPIGKLVATGYYPSYSIGEQEVGLRAEFNFVGYDKEGEPLQIISAELIEKPAGSEATLVKIGSWKPLGKKIQKLDVVGTYRVRMTVSDGVNELVTTATMEAKIGNVNGQPSTRGVNAQSNSVLVGDQLVFDASSKDPNSDPMTFHWELTDKPDGSKAVIEAVTEPESQELRRAIVITDVPGSYTARLIVEDDRGLFAKSYAQEHGFAKLVNTAPIIRSVVWARNWSRLSPDEKFYQILPCMSLLHRPVVVDADGDEVFTHEELISTPEGGKFTSYPSKEDCPDTRGQVFTKPGTYTFRYYASDGIDDAADYDFVVKVDSFDEAKGVRLRSINAEGESLWRPLPYENIPPFANGFRASAYPYLEEGAIAWSLSAIDADYTIENVVTRHINGDLTGLTPWFEGLSEGQIITQGESLNFKTWLPAVPCLRNNDKAEGFHLSFNIKEIPEITFVYETWRAANDQSSRSEWRQCTEGELN